MENNVIDITKYLDTNIHTCSLCKLHKNRTQVVLGYGSSEANIMLIGEAPGEEEDELGIPFVGKSGKLLSKALLKAGLHRSEIYITNVCKCRPPSNRNPEQEEIDTCLSWLRSEVEDIKPKVIGTLGNFSTKVFLGEDISITKVRGKTHIYNGLNILPIYHPSYVLRNRGGDIETDFYNDINLLKVEGEKS